MEIKQINSYQIVEQIAEGGMGIVYKAVDQNSENIVALKTLKEAVNPDSETFIRFKKEAELLEQLSHENILKFIDFIEKDAHVYIVTEFLQGQTLKQMIADSKLTMDERVKIIYQISLALDYVHTQGVIHRDIKPSNVMVVQDNIAKILDFGVANLMNFQKLFNVKEGVVGSFSYMSPEQSGMLKRNIDHRSDLYSLGIVFYQLVTGQLPYQAKEIGELLHQHIAKIPEEPINIVKGLSPIINKIILKLIKKDPDDRYQTAYGLSEDLSFYLNLNEEQKNTFYLELGKKDRLKNLNYRTSLVGRKSELKHLLNSLNNTILGKGFVSAIIGKSGMGKTRLISELQKYTASKNAFFVSVVNGERDQNYPYFPLIEAVKRLLELFRKFPKALKVEIYHHIKDKLGEEGRILSKMIPEISEILGKYDEQLVLSKKENELFFEKLKDFFLYASSPSHPIILSFDDAHFWDHGSIHFFDYFKDFIDNSSIYLILSIREEMILKSKELYEIIRNKAKPGQIGIVSLHPIEADNIEELLTEIFGSLPNGINELSARLNESAQGNPLLIVENIKTLVEEEILTQKNEKWNIDLERLSYFRFSSSITDKILSRLLKISPKTREVLGTAAILGKDFNFSILFSILKNNQLIFNQEELLDILKEATEGQLITENFSEKGEIFYSFAHDKVSETLLAQMQEAKIKKNHHIAAEIIESQYQERDKVYKLAYHYLMADSRNKAYYYNLQAGRQAISSYSFKLALSFLHHALEILKKFAKNTPKAIRSRINLSLEISEISLNINASESNIKLLDEVLVLADKIESSEDLAKIYFYLGKNYYLLGNQAKALPYYQKAIPIAESLNLPELLAMPYCAIGRANTFISYYKEAIDYLEKGITKLPEKTADQTIILERIFSLGVLAQSYASIGYKAKAFERLNEMESFHKDSKNEVIKLYIQFYKAAVLSMIGDPHQALIESKRSLEMSKDLKNKLIEIYSVFSVGRAYGNMGKLDEAIRYSVSSVNLGKENNISLGFMLIYFFLAENYTFLGNIKVAKENLAEAEKLTGISNPMLISQWKNRLLALFEFTSSTPDFYQGFAYIEEAIKVAEEMGVEYEFFVGLNLIVKSLLKLKAGKNDEAQELDIKATEIFKKYDMLEVKENYNRLKDRILAPMTTSKTGTAEGAVSDATHTYTMTFTQTEFSYERQLKYLLKLSEQLAQVHEMELLLPKIMSLAIEVSGAERGILFLHENPNDLSSALSIMAKKSIDLKEEQGDMVYSASLLKHTLSTGHGQLIMDAEKELVDDKTVVEFKMKSIITVPLVTSGRILGAIYLDNRQVKGLFTEENFELLKAFTVEAAISIENARLYKEVQAKARIEQEMEIAKDIQTSILPFIQESPGYDISAFMKTATEVGGDYYDFYLDEKPYFGVFGDVSGHGLKSGIIMMMAEVVFNAIMRDSDLKQKDLAILYQIINSTLFENIQKRLSKKSKLGHQYSHLYMTFRMFRFDDDGNFEMFGNDHAEPFICRAETGEIETIRSTGFLLGIMEDAIIKNKTFRFKLNPGDLLVLYSDGITEAKKEAKSKISGRDRKILMFGEDRLFEVVTQNRKKSSQEIINCVLDSVTQWMAEQEDDITIAVLKRK